MLFNWLTVGRQAESLTPRRLPFKIKCLLAAAGNTTQVAQGKVLEGEDMWVMCFWWLPVFWVTWTPSSRGTWTSSFPWNSRWSCWSIQSVSTVLCHWCVGCPQRHVFTPIVMCKVRRVQMMDEWLRALAYQTPWRLKLQFLDRMFPAFSTRRARCSQATATKGERARLHPCRTWGARLHLGNPPCPLHPSWGPSAPRSGCWSSLSSPHPDKEWSHERGSSNQRTVGQRKVHRIFHSLETTGMHTPARTWRGGRCFEQGSLGTTLVLQPLEHLLFEWASPLCSSLGCP